MTSPKLKWSTQDSIINRSARYSKKQLFEYTSIEQSDLLLLQIKFSVFLESRCFVYHKKSTDIFCSRREVLIKLFCLDIPSLSYSKQGKRNINKYLMNRSNLLLLCFFFDDFFQILSFDLSKLFCTINALNFDWVRKANQKFSFFIVLKEGSLMQEVEV